MPERPWRGATRNAQIEAGGRRGEHTQFLDEGVFIVDDYVKSADVGEGARVDEWRTEQQRDRKAAKHRNGGHRPEQRQKQAPSQKRAGRLS